MKYNESLISEYGGFSEVLGESPMAFKPTPSKKDYESGYITRVFARKRNDDATVEIKMAQSESININLYKIVTVKWAVSGPKYNIVKNNITEHQGVIDQNKYEIERVIKEHDVDLTKSLSNLLEFWQGH